MISAEWSETSGVLVLSLGRCILGATDDLLTIRAEASDPDSLARIQELITKRLHSFGRRDGLTVSWQPAPDRTGGPDSNSASGGAGRDAGGPPRSSDGRRAGRGSCRAGPSASATDGPDQV